MTFARKITMLLSGAGVSLLLSSYYAISGTHASHKMSEAAMDRMSGMVPPNEYHPISEPNINFRKRKIINRARRTRGKKQPRLAARDMIARNGDKPTTRINGTIEEYNIDPHGVVSREDWENYVAKRWENIPPLTEMIDRERKMVTADDVSYMLDFAIVGFAKCGTTTLMESLRTNQTHVLEGEQCNLGSNQVWKVVKQLYREFPRNGSPRPRMGLKCPRDIDNHLSLENYARFFPKTDMIITLRHPVRWFESFYNFRFGPQQGAPRTEELGGKCLPSSQGVCAGRGNFHTLLARLGKTNLTQSEKQIWPKRERKRVGVLGKGVQGKIMLIHTEQMADKTRQVQLLEDLRKFLRVPNPLPPLTYVRPDRVKANGLAEPRTHINICDEEHDGIRKILLKQGAAASIWIEKYFIESEDVFISSPDFFVEILRTWQTDPCDQIDNTVENKGEVDMAVASEKVSHEIENEDKQDSLEEADDIESELEQQEASDESNYRDSEEDYNSGIDVTF